MARKVTPPNKAKRKKLPRNFKDEEIYDAYIRGGCTIAGCALALGMSRRHMFRLIDERKLRPLLNEANEELGDLIEMSAVELAVEKQDPATIRFMLSTKYKSRGYARFDNAVQQNTDNRVIIVNFNNAKDEKDYETQLEDERKRRLGILGALPGPEDSEVSEG